MSWNLALSVGSLVLIAGGVAAIMRRAMRFSQALGVLGIAVAVALVAAFASRLVDEGAVGTLYLAAVALTCAIGGAAMAVAIVVRRPNRLR